MDDLAIKLDVACFLREVCDIFDVFDDTHTLKPLPAKILRLLFDATQAALPVERWQHPPSQPRGGVRLGASWGNRGDGDGTIRTAVRQFLQRCAGILGQ